MLFTNKIVSLCKKSINKSIEKDIVESLISSASISIRESSYNPINFTDTKTQSRKTNETKRRKERIIHLRASILRYEAISGTWKISWILKRTFKERAAAKVEKIETSMPKTKATGIQKRGTLDTSPIKSRSMLPARHKGCLHATNRPPRRHPRPSRRTLWWRLSK